MVCLSGSWEVGKLGSCSIGQSVCQSVGGHSASSTALVGQSGLVVNGPLYLGVIRCAFVCSRMSHNTTTSDKGALECVLRVNVVLTAFLLPELLK